MGGGASCPALADLPAAPANPLKRLFKAFPRLSHDQTRMPVQVAVSSTGTSYLLPQALVHVRRSGTRRRGWLAGSCTPNRWAAAGRAETHAGPSTLHDPSDGPSVSGAYLRGYQTVP